MDGRPGLVRKSRRPSQIMGSRLLACCVSHISTARECDTSLARSLACLFAWLAVCPSMLRFCSEGEGVTIAKRSGGALCEYQHRTGVQVKLDPRVNWYLIVGNPHVLCSVCALLLLLLPPFLPPSLSKHAKTCCFRWMDGWLGDGCMHACGLFPSSRFVRLFSRRRVRDASMRRVRSSV